MKTSPTIKLAALALVLIAVAALSGCGGRYAVRPPDPKPDTTTLALGGAPLVSTRGARTTWHQPPELVVQALVQFAAEQEKAAAKLAARVKELEAELKRRHRKVPR